MKKLLFALCMLSAMPIYADIIVTSANGNIEDVKVISLTSKEVIYNQAGQEKTLPSAQVEGVLYDDGRYITPPKQEAVSTAYGNGDDLFTSSDKDASGNTIVSEDSWGFDDSNTQKNEYNDKRVAKQQGRRSKESDATGKEKKKFSLKEYYEKVFKIKPKSSDSKSSDSQSSENQSSDSNW